MKEFYESHAVELCAYSSNFTQSLNIKPDVVKHIDCHRQLSLRDHEAGGQLFGRILPEIICVDAVEGPYKHDSRGRFHYRSDPKCAQRNILKHKEAGRLYLGEWHTHAEPSPIASTHDIKAMNALIRMSKININGLLLLIAGQSLEPKGISIYSFFNGGHQVWEINNTFT
ncbi:MAG TPA: Mov34/MPN/PAD-1 family protein [Pseudomonadales bacterium]|nr:Mov34/MPN/PAD-1 family protein [Pseudomonadales bacterium]